MRSWIVLSLLLAAGAMAQDNERLVEQLSAPDAGVQAQALNQLLNVDRPLDDQAVRAALLRLLDDANADLDVRASVVWLFGRHGSFDAVSKTALALAGDHSNPHVAHTIARMIVTVDETVRFDNSGIRALREEALQVAYGCGKAGTTSLLLALAKDRSEPEWVRGDAIRELGACPDDPVNRAALLELLDRSHWFFGAQGQHFLVHSLSLVIQPFAHSDDPAIRTRLLRLRSEIAALPPEERDYVEWTLGNALRERREVFGGPVEPHE